MATTTTAGHRVLVFDDDVDSYDNLAQVFHKLGFIADHVTSIAMLRERLSAACKYKEWYQFIMIDLDLTKLGVPDIDGEKVYRMLKPDYNEENYILYSKYYSDSYRQIVSRLAIEKVPLILCDRFLTEDSLMMSLAPMMGYADPRYVFLVHGRNSLKTNQMESLLHKAYGLEVVNWEAAVEATPGGRNYNYEIVLKGIELSHVTVVLFTDDEVVSLRKKYRVNPKEDVNSFDDKNARRQARSNVYIEAGYAIGVRPKRTIFVEWPDRAAGFDSPSDFDGMNVIRYADTPEGREKLRSRLEAARCVMKLHKQWKGLKLSN
jgi:predicted nucleotide-binding protein